MSNNTNKNEKLVSATIDGIPVNVSSKMTILEAASKTDIKIPTLCFLKNVSNVGMCRVCSVEVEGRENLVPACKTKIEDGMVISTKSERAVAYRKMMLELILAEHGLDSTNYCFSCNKNGACELQAVCREVGVAESAFASAFEPPFVPKEPKPRKAVLDSNPFLTFDPNLCIQCQRCIGACNNMARNHTLQAGRRGGRIKILAPFGHNWDSTQCESCGNCAQACPTGAITEKRRKEYRAWEVQRVRTTCPHCATGCQFDAIVKDGHVIDIDAAKGPANEKRLCVKGRSASFDFVHSPDRLTTPLIKNKETGKFEKATWNEALDLVASKFGELKEKYGPDSLAAFACSRSTNEDIYMLQKMARICFGTNNVDNCARVCHGPSVAGLATTLGSGAMTNPIADITTNVDVIMLVGSNPEEAHPVIGMQIRRAVEQGTKLIVVDPRNIGLTKHADIHLKLKPGTNVAFSNGMCHVMIKEGLIDKAYIVERTEGFESFAKMVDEYTPERVAEICGIDARDLIAAARLYASADKAPIIYCLGVTEHSSGTEGVMSMSNMALCCGKLGRSGCGVNPLRGQNNVQGACDMGAQPNTFPGYQKVVDPAVIEKFQNAWGVPLNTKIGMFATEVFHAASNGIIKGLFIFGEDQVRTDPDIQHVINGLEALEFFVVDDLFMTETAKYADVVLPGSAYLEKEGTFTNTERRVQRVRKAVNAPGDAKLDTWIFTEIMRRMGYDQPHLTAAEIMNEIASVTPSYGGISHARLDSTAINGRGLQWPCLDANHPGTPIMHVGTFSRGKALFSNAPYRPAVELPDDDYPFILSTGRILVHYNATAMTSRTPGINEIEDSSFIEVNDEDAERLGIVHGDRVRVFSRRGSIETTARVSPKTRPGSTWMPFHFQNGNANWLTIASFDTICACPEYKVCAVNLEKA